MPLQKSFLLQAVKMIINNLEKLFLDDPLSVKAIDANYKANDTYSMERFLLYFGKWGDKHVECTDCTNTNKNTLNRCVLISHPAKK